MYFPQARLALSPVAESEQSLLAVLSVPPNTFLRLFTSLGALILVGRTSEMQIFIR
jgi:hypothetical protein